MAASELGVWLTARINPILVELVAERRDTRENVRALCATLVGIAAWTAANYGYSAEEFSEIARGAYAEQAPARSRPRRPGS